MWKLQSQVGKQEREKEAWFDQTLILILSENSHVDGDPSVGASYPTHTQINARLACFWWLFGMRLSKKKRKRTNEILLCSVLILLYAILKSSLFGSGAFYSVLPRLCDQVVHIDSYDATCFRYPVNDPKSFWKLGPYIKKNGVSPLPLLYLGITSPVMRTPRRLTYASSPAIPICTLVLSSDGASRYG